MVKTSESGRVTAIDYIIDEGRPGRSTIHLTGTPDDLEDR